MATTGSGGGHTHTYTAIPGPQGPQGVPGPIGPQGPAGPVDTTLAARVTALEAAVAALQPATTPVYTPVPASGLVAALNAAPAGATLWLDGDYPIGPIGDWGGTDLRVMPVPGKTARILATTQSTLLYAGWGRSATRCTISGITIVGADILQADSNGSSLIGFGPLATDVVYDGCTLLGSPAWTGNLQHLAYWFGDGSGNINHGCGLRDCILDGRGMLGSGMVNFNHPTAAAGALISDCSLRNADIGIAIWDHPSSGIVIDSCHFSAIRIGVRHNASSGTQLLNSTFAADVTDPWYVDGDAAAFTQSGNVTGA